MGCVALYIYIVLITLVARREKMSDGLDKLIKHHSLHWSPFSWNDTSIFGFVEPELDQFGTSKGKFFTWVQLGVDHQYRSTWVLLTHRLVTTFTRLYLGIRYLSLLYQWWMNKFWWCKIYIYHWRKILKMKKESVKKLGGMAAQYKKPISTSPTP